ncbi:hypothetical protein GOP47_0030096 [Adiantum capillus-veneris]|nr:hypothetical protein GOP47_0030096 [Adiantum capillus-veneris]
MRCVHVDKRLTWRTTEAGEEGQGIRGNGGLTHRERLFWKLEALNALSAGPRPKGSCAWGSQHGHAYFKADQGKHTMD